MSQSAENQSAIIENENNSNIVMESQAAMSGEDFPNRNLRETVAPEEAGPGTPTQDEFEESMETEEAGAGDMGPGGSETAPAASLELLSGAGDASQESTVMESRAEELAVQDEVPELGCAPDVGHSPVPAAGETEEEPPAEAMDVEEPERLEAEPVEESETEPTDRLEERYDVDDDPEADDIALIPSEDPPELDDVERDEVDRNAEDNQDQAGEAQEFQEGAAHEQEEEEVVPEPDVLETEEEGNLEAVHSVQEADRGLQDNEDLSQDQTEEGETGMSAEDEDRLLAEENSQSQTYDEQFSGGSASENVTDEPECFEDYSQNTEAPLEAAADTGEDAVDIEDAAGVLQDEPEVTDGIQDYNQSAPEIVNREEDMAENVTYDGQSGASQDMEAAAEISVSDDVENVADSVSGPEAMDEFPHAVDSHTKVRDVVDVDAEPETAAQAEDEPVQAEDEPVQAGDEPVQSEDEPICAEDQQVQPEDETNEPIQSESETVQAEDETVPAEEKVTADQETNVERTSVEAVDKEASADGGEADEDGDVSMTEQAEEASDQQGHDGQDEGEKPMEETMDEVSKEAESKPSSQDEQEEGASSGQVIDADATTEEGRDTENESTMQVSDIKSEAEGETKQRAEAKGSEEGTRESSEAMEPAEAEASPRASQAKNEPADLVKSESKTSTDSKAASGSAPDDDDVVVLDDEDDTAPGVKKEAVEKELFNTNNDMGIQIESVSGGADELHELADQHPVKQENGVEQKPAVTSAAPVKKDPQPTKKTAAKVQTCIVCKRIGKCKYNIVRNGDIKHLCDDTCFKRFRTNPTMFLKGTATTAGTATPPADKKKPAPSKAAERTSLPPVPPKAPSVSGYKTCVVCQLMNINTQGQFCMWKGLDFCGEGCLGKFQAGISTSCTLCTAFIPQAARSTNCLRLGSEVRPFCSSRCFADYKLRMRLCAYCQKDLSVAPDSFSAPVGSEGSFKDFCSQPCMKKYEDLLNTDVEIIRVEGGKTRGINKCSVCQKSEVIKHSVKYNGVVSNLCSDPCLSAFQYANKLNMVPCDHCSTLCSTLEATPHTVQFEGYQKRFCSDACVTKFRFNHRKSTPCSWCGSQRDNFDMIERLDSNNKYQLFCSLNCLSLYRVNLQAKSNQAVTCDQCLKYVPAQYHLTMSDASVRNFCSYNCVMTFQSQFSKGPPPTTPTPPPPRHKHNTRGRGSKNVQQPAGSPSFPIISNVVSLAPQGGQKVNIKNNSGVPVVVSGASPGTKGTGPVQQQIIIQPPPPKQVKNKSLLCKPFTQTKATSCRPHTQTKDTQTDPIKDKPVLIPVPVPTYVPVPMAMYAAPAPTPVFIPIPIPIPVFIPTTRKSANGILKQIKEIQEKTPADPLEAEILMMAAAVSADGKASSDSESDEELLTEIRSKKRHLAADDDDDGDMMPLASGGKEEEGGEEDMISMALRMAEEMSGPITDLESAVEAVPINTEPPPQPPRVATPDTIQVEELNLSRTRRGAKRGGGGGGGTRRSGAGRPPKRQRMLAPQPEPLAMHQEPPPPPAPPADADYHLKFTYGVNAWRHWVLFKNAQIERNAKPGGGRYKLFKTDIMQCTADELNYSLCLFVKEVRKPNGEEYSPDSIYYLTLGIQQYLFENGRIDNLFADLYYERFTECLTEILSKCQPKFNASGQMVCRIEEEHLWECKQLGAHSPYVLLNTLIYFHTKYFMLKTPEDHMKLSFAHILKYWKKGQPGKGGQPTRCVSLRYYSVSTAKKDGSAPTSATKKGSKEGIPVYDVTENLDNPLRCPVKLYEFYLSKCPESIKNRSDIFYPVPERSCVPDSPVWYSTTPISLEVMTKMLTRILLVREIQEAHLHAQPIYV